MHNTNPSLPPLPPSLHAEVLSLGDELEFAAIQAIHSQLDDNHDGQVDLSESEEVSHMCTTTVSSAMITCLAQLMCQHALPCVVKYSIVHVYSYCLPCYSTRCTVVVIVEVRNGGGEREGDGHIVTCPGVT